jgi:hypothetical protein
MNSHNSFLKEFLNMRKTIAPPGPSPQDVLPQKKKKAKMSSNPPPLTESVGINTIIEEKPHKRVVIEYLQKRANEFTVEKMK